MGDGFKVQGLWGKVASPFDKGGSRGISPRVVRVRTSANPHWPPFGKWGKWIQLA